MNEEKTDKRRQEEGSLHEVVANDLVIRRLPLKKQKEMRQKVKLSRAEYTFLQYTHAIWKWALANHDLTRREIDILLYISPLITFTFNDFRKCLRELGSDDAGTFSKFKKKGWVKLWSDSDGKKFYVLSTKASTLIARIYRMHMMDEEIPTSPRRNVIAKKDSKKDKDLMKLFSKFNNLVREKNG